MFFSFIFCCCCSFLSIFKIWFYLRSGNACNLVIIFIRKWFMINIFKLKSKPILVLFCMQYKKWFRFQANFFFELRTNFIFIVLDSNEQNSINIALHNQKALRLDFFISLTLFIIFFSNRKHLLFQN